MPELWRTVATVLSSSSHRQVSISTVFSNLQVAPHQRAKATGRDIETDALSRPYTAFAEMTEGNRNPEQGS